MHTPADLDKITMHFHALILRRSAEFVEVPDLDLPQLSLVLALEDDGDRAWFPVPGMYGGFAYAWDPEAPGTRLVVESWSRVVGGSGQRHVITADGATLVEEGFC